MSCCGVTHVAASVPAAVLDWAAVTTITDTLAKAVAVGSRPDVVVGILRGGMIPAVLLAHALGLREVRALDVTHTITDGVNAAKAPSPVVRNLASLGDLSGLNVLLVDDIAGTGETMRACRDMAAQAGASTVRTAACAFNEANWPPDGGDPLGTFTYVGARYRGWVVFPWENQ